jgi:hypothetical protein
MVSLAGTLAPENAHALARQGYAIQEWIGFAVHEIPMYTHMDSTNARVGDVVFSARVSNPKSLNNMEANFIARKGAKGYFMWKPGEECMKHTFKDFEFKPRPLGGVEKIEHPSYRGCKWCRERAAAITTAPEPVHAVVPPDSVNTPPAPALPTEDVLHCREEGCAEIFTGERAEQDRRLHLRRVHNQLSPRTARRSSRRAPRTGSAKES